MTEPVKRPFKIADNFIKALVDVGLFSEEEFVYTRRVVLDFQVGKVPKMYVERLADPRISDVILEGGLRVESIERVTA